VRMVGALADRGPDSSGIAVYSRPELDVRSAVGPVDVAKHKECCLRRVSLGSDSSVDWMALCEALEGRLAFRGTKFTSEAFVSGAILCMSPEDESTTMALVDSMWPTVRVLGTGNSVKVVKDTGRPEKTCSRNGIDTWQGYMAVAHTRMATESAVTLLHSHPFVPADDMCVVHNGSFSNYASVRRRLRAEGTGFDSDNDSEVAARLLARRLGAGDGLEEAIRHVTKEMDGFFTLVISTPSTLSVVRDAFACKPAVVAETDEYVAVASEYRALAALPDVENARVFEPKPEEVYTWRC
jgi:methylamine---glutamate N-methyltransferase subunit A